MKALGSFPQIYLHRQPVDFRKSINGLLVIVEQAMGLSSMQPALFVFCNKSRDKIKALYWDNTGYCLWYKRLEVDKFRWPLRVDDEVLELSAEQFDWLLNGMDIITHKPLIYSHFNVS